MIPGLINAINHIERAGDHTVSLVTLCRTKMEHQLSFSQEAVGELRELQQLIMEMFEFSVKTIMENDLEMLNQIALLEEKVDKISANLVQSHIRRLEASKCTVESGVIFIDIVNYLERIADHVYKYCRDASVELKTREDGKVQPQVVPN
jgi:phosphate:Na+ symporter